MGVMQGLTLGGDLWSIKYLVGMLGIIHHVVQRRTLCPYMNLNAYSAPNFLNFLTLSTQDQLEMKCPKCGSEQFRAHYEQLPLCHGKRHRRQGCQFPDPQLLQWNLYDL